ncbi:MAG TPA: nucleotidyl transferase AbiEii/AbiGii toxin family protein [Gaiellaceae bacterium]|nr:nucleotidyl transferase AbiEii/AbiGii toxin family protein [Gaiellaceae bacterium]
MSPDYPREKRPSNVRHLQRVVSAAASAKGVVPGRMQYWLSTMALLGALERSNDCRKEQRRGLLLKGGVAIELRLGIKARTTKDVDFVFYGHLDALLEDLDRAFAKPHSGFDFERGGPQKIRDTGSYRFDVKIYYGEKRQPWQTLQVEVSPSEIDPLESDEVPAISIEDLGLSGPKTVRCLSLRYQIAQKIHACTERIENRENDRSRDLIDLILLRDLVDDLASVREACVITFERRERHAWPPELTIEPSWPEVYTAEAKRYGFDVEAVEDAARLVRAFIAATDAASRPAASR